MNVPTLVPPFVSEGAAMYHELRKRGTRTRPGPLTPFQGRT